MYLSLAAASRSDALSSGPLPATSLKTPSLPLSSFLSAPSRGLTNVTGSETSPRAMGNGSKVKPSFVWCRGVHVEGGGDAADGQGLGRVAVAQANQVEQELLTLGIGDGFIVALHVQANGGGPNRAAAHGEQQKKQSITRSPGGHDAHLAP